MVSVGVFRRPMCVYVCMWTMCVINGRADVSGLTAEPATPHFLPVMEMRK